MLGEPVEVVVLGTTATVLSARLMWRGEESLGLAMSPMLPRGTPVCIRTHEGDRWMHGRVDSDGTEVLHVSVRGTQPRDRREFNRSWGAIRVRWKVAEGNEIDRWMTGEEVGGAWHRPDPFMDFSGSGLKFHDATAPAAGEMVLVELGLPRERALHRATARVVRVREIPLEERDEAPHEPGATIPTHAVAIHFEDIAPGTTEALVGFGERIAEALI